MCGKTQHKKELLCINQTDGANALTIIPATDATDPNPPQLLICIFEMANILSLRSIQARPIHHCKTAMIQYQKPMQFCMKIKRSYFNKTCKITRNHVPCNSRFIERCPFAHALLECQICNKVQTDLVQSIIITK